MRFTVTTDQLTYAAGQCRTTNDQIQGQIGRMQGYIAGLMGSYQGTAAVALQRLSDQWSADSKSLNFVLSTIADGLTTNANNYDTSESANTANLASITAGLPAARI